MKMPDVWCCAFLSNPCLVRFSNATRQNSWWWTGGERSILLEETLTLGGYDNRVGSFLPYIPFRKYVKSHPMVYERSATSRQKSVSEIQISWVGRSTNQLPHLGVTFFRFLLVEKWEIRAFLTDECFFWGFLFLRNRWWLLQPPPLRPWNETFLG